MQKVFLGIDVGSVAVKIAAVDENAKVIHSSSHRVFGKPAETAVTAVSEIADLSLEKIVVTGTGAEAVAADAEVKGSVQSGFKCLIEAVCFFYPNARTVFEMGGESSKFLRIENGQVVEYGINGDCAAGTGSFIDQQAERLHCHVEDIGPLAAGAEKTARVAGRCSVFAKSDMIHAQQKGYTPPEILKGLCLAVVRNFKATIVRGRRVEQDVVFVGGLAKNSGVVAAMKETFGLKDVIVPAQAEFMTAIGAALLARQQIGASVGHKRAATLPNHQHDNVKTGRLSVKNVRFLRDLVKPYKFPVNGRVDAYLGIDVGSVSTNFVVLDKAGDLISEIYIYTKSRPIEVVTKGLRDLEEAIGGKVNICGVGTTGSGRELIGELVGADVIKDEITAHKTGAVHICKKLTGGQVDTIFEIGGQDAKFISIESGVVTEFAMNEACAAGTGSFLEEQATRLGVNIKREFAKLALASKNPVPLGERCTVFMERDVNLYRIKGRPVEDIVAGLAYSVATNYLNRVVRGRHIGDHIFFQGGTAYNDAVAAAFSQILGKTITVPPHNGVIGAVGAALLAMNGRATKDARFRGFNLGRVSYTMREFPCNACSNGCDIQEFSVEGEKTYWGDKCSSKFRKTAHTSNVPVIGDLLGIRSKLLQDRPRNNSRRIGIPRTMFYFDRFPFWQAYFEKMGFEVVTSDDTNKAVARDSLELSVAEPCYPIKLAHGHVRNLVEKGAELIFLPNVITSERLPDVRPIPYLCPWHQTLPFVIRAVPAFSDVKFLTPTIQFELGREFVAGCLKKTGFYSGEALSAAYEAQLNFDRELKRHGAAALRELNKSGRDAVVLVGRPYNIYDAGANLNVPARLRRFYGLNVIPLDFLPLDEIDVGGVSNNMFWNYGRKIIAAAKFVAERGNLHLIYITNFKCGPDSFIKHFSTWASGKPYLTLQFDEHANDAGVITRIEAYLESKGLLCAN